MNLTTEQIDIINSNEWVVFATSDKNNQPRASLLTPSVVESDKIILSNMQMGKTAENLRINPNVFISAYDKTLDKCVKITGLATIESSGTLFDKIKALEATRCEFIPKEIIVVTIESIETSQEN